MTITDPDQARLLSDRESVRYLAPFVARERSVSQAAKEVGCGVDTMLYRVRTFLSVGLLEVARLQPRSGRPIKFYRTVSDAFFVPFSATPYASLEERLARELMPFQQKLVRASAHLLRQSGREGRRIYRTAGGEVWNDSAAGAHSPLSIDDADLPPAYDFSVELELDSNRARQLQRDLHALFERYAEDGRPSRGRTYLWQIALVPAAPE